MLVVTTGVVVLPLTVVVLLFVFVLLVVVVVVVAVALFVVTPVVGVTEAPLTVVTVADERVAGATAGATAEGVASTAATPASAPVVVTGVEVQATKQTAKIETKFFITLKFPSFKKSC